ncbi:MAG: hypothetical protein OXT09_18210 [Myxococcales bacterium]|nr:hypothetical protein [Myxococcales bacterium]
MTTATATLDGPDHAVEAPVPDVRPPAPATSWAQGYLSVQSDDDLQRIAARAGAGMGLSALFGLAMGVGSGPASMWRHVLTVEAAVGSVVVMAVPALHVLLTLLDAPIDPLRMAERCSHAVFRTGLLLAGLSPALALYSTTTGATGSALLGIVMLYLAGCVGLHTLVSGIAASVRAASEARGRAALLLAGFTIFSIVLVMRMSAGFPVFGGGQ